MKGTLVIDLKVLHSYRHDQICQSLRSTSRNTKNSTTKYKYFSFPLIETSDGK